MPAISANASKGWGSVATAGQLPPMPLSADFLRHHRASSVEHHPLRPFMIRMDSNLEF